jgi:hypothetical protein
MNRAIVDKRRHDKREADGKSLGGLGFQVHNAVRILEIVVKFRNKAVQIAGQKEGSGSFNLAQVCNLYDYATKNWRYVNDPATLDYVAKASESIQTQQSDDCDDFAVLIGSLILAVGGDVRINYAYDANSGHSFAEVKLGDYIDESGVTEYITLRYKVSATEVHIRDGWLNLDWFDQPKCPGGTFFDWYSIQTFYILEHRFE